MKVKFIGNPNDSSDNRGFIDWAGVRFPLNEAVDLPEGKVFEKIPHNSHFEVVEDAQPAEDEPTISGMNRAELIAIAEEQGVKVDKRWNVGRIAEAIGAAANAAESDGE